MVKTYSVNTFDAWLQTAGDDPAGSFVRYEDYAALRSKAIEVLREASEVYRLYNKTQDPDGNFIDGQTLQELNDLL